METMLVVIIGLLVGVIITHLFQNTIKKDNNNNITADDFNSMKSAIEEIKGLAVDSKEDRLITKGQVQEQYTQVMSVIKEQEKTTTKLTTALTGSNKQQGNWGEVILKNLLSNAGFQEGRDYTSQVKYDSPDGENKQQPDVIINLPENRQIIIDSKVSLKDWYEFMNAENEDSRKEALKKHIASMQRHIKQLASTDYQKLYQIEKR